jgi:hypothetical protein
LNRRGLLPYALVAAQQVLEAERNRGNEVLAPDSPGEIRMPLSPPAPREKLHTRSIQIEGFERADGLYDIEARLADHKARGFSNLDRGVVGPDEPLHEMLMRLTIDEQMVIVSAEASTEHGPFNQCSGGAASYALLAGLQIKAGFLKEAAARLGGIRGCTHIREVLQQLATTAFQTMWQVRMQREQPGSDAESDASARLVDTCFAYDSAGEAVRRRWPHLYTGPAAEAQLAGAGSRGA